jgi:hypothetical protein
MNIVCPNRLCGKVGCYDHCNFCGQDVLWRPPLLDKEIRYRGPKPLNPPDGTFVHRCMRGGTQGRGFFKTEPVQPKKEEEIKPPWPLPLPEGVHLGTTHLWLKDKNEFVPLYKCPLCNFQNIHKDIINHHIKYAFDTYHNQSGLVI